MNRIAAVFAPGLALTIGLAATPSFAADKTEPVKDSVVVSDEAETIFMDKRSPEERDPVSKDAAPVKGVIVVEEAQEI